MATDKLTPPQRQHQQRLHRRRMGSHTDCWRLQPILWVLFLFCFDQFVFAAPNNFLWISDIHLEPYYGTPEAMSLNKLGEFDCSSENKSSTHPFGDYGCDAPQDLVELVLERSSSLENVDFVIITGDFVRHGTDALPNPMNTTQHILSTVSDLIKKYHPTIPVIASLGNNDVTPDYYLDVDHPEEMLTMVTNGLSTLLGDDNADAFRLGGYYAQNVTSLMTILSMNTVLYSINRQPQPQTVQPDPLGQFQWMEEQLYIAKQAQRHVYILGHIPPSIGSYRHTQLWQEHYLETYYQIVANYADIIKGHLFGHIHTDEFRFHGGIPLLMASSITPIYGSNPSVRLVSYNVETSEVTDYEVHYVDLAETINNNNTALAWKRGESFCQAFGLPDMSVASLQTILDNLKNTSVTINFNEEDINASSITVSSTSSTSTNKSLDYWEILLSRVHIYTHGSEVCDKSCQKEWICTLSSMTAVQYNACLFDKEAAMGWKEWWKITPVRSTALSLLVALAFFLCVACTVRSFFHKRRDYQVPSGDHHHQSHEEEEGHQLPSVT